MKATVTFQYTYFSSCHPPGVKKGFIKGEALRILRTNSSETAVKTAVSQFKTNLIQRGYPETLVSTTLAEIAFEGRNSALQQKRKENKRIWPFVTQYRPSVPNLKQILMRIEVNPQNSQKLEPAKFSSDTVTSKQRGAKYLVVIQPCSQGPLSFYLEKEVERESWE